MYLVNAFLLITQATIPIPIYIRIIDNNIYVNFV